MSPPVTTKILTSSSGKSHNSTQLESLPRSTHLAFRPCPCLESSPSIDPSTPSHSQVYHYIISPTAPARTFTIALLVVDINNSLSPHFRPRISLSSQTWTRRYSFPPRLFLLSPHVSLVNDASALLLSTCSIAIGLSLTGPGPSTDPVCVPAGLSPRYPALTTHKGLDAIPRSAI